MDGIPKRGEKTAFSSFSGGKKGNVPVKSKLQHPPRAFLENFCSNPTSLGRKAVQMPPPARAEERSLISRTAAGNRA